MTLRHPDPVERRVGISQDAYLALFLDRPDFPDGMRQEQDTRLMGPDRSDRAFPRYQGILTGLAVWMGRTDQPLWRVVDARFAFPTTWQASAYHAVQWGYNAEGQPPVADAPAVGEEYHVFGGTSEIFGIPLTAFMYLFRVRRVVVKLFAAQGQEAGNDPLTVHMVMALAERAAERIAASTPAP